MRIHRAMQLASAGIVVLAACWTALAVSVWRPQASGNDVMSGAKSVAVANVSAPRATLLGDSRSLIAGVPDTTAGVWALSRDRGDRTLHLSHVLADSVSSDIAVPLPDAGMHAGITVNTEDVWVGTGSEVIRYDRTSRSITSTTHLPPAHGAVARAARAPDGTVLGLGNITSLAIVPNGVLIARYAMSSVTFLRTTGEIEEFAFDEQYDPDKIVVARENVWFTVNYGPGSRLASAVGRMNLFSHKVTFMPLEARSLVARGDGVHALGEAWTRIEDSGDVVQLTKPTIPLDSSTETIDRNGRLVAREARQTKLVLIDAAGNSSVVNYEQGTFVNSAGRATATNSPLAFAGTDGGGVLWFGARGGAVIYAAP